MAQNNTFNTLGRNQRNINHAPHHNNANHGSNNVNLNQGHHHHPMHNGGPGVGGYAGTEIVTNTLGRNNRYNDVPITNPLFHIR